MVASKINVPVSCSPEGQIWGGFCTAFQKLPVAHSGNMLTDAPLIITIFLLFSSLPCLSLFSFPVLPGTIRSYLLHQVLWWLAIIAGLIIDPKQALPSLKSLHVQGYNCPDNFCIVWLGKTGAVEATIEKEKNATFGDPCSVSGHSLWLSW